VILIVIHHRQNPSDSNRENIRDDNRGQGLKYYYPCSLITDSGLLLASLKSLLEEAE
jgi:hypothetical protein